MFSQNNIIYYYLLGKQKTTNLKNYIIMNFFGFTNATMLISGQQTNISLRYLLFRFITKFFWFFSYPQYMTNLTGDKLHLTKLTDKGEKTLIISSPDGITLNNMTIELYKSEDTPKMVNCIFFKFTITTNDTNLCIKNLMIKYADPENKYQHTLENILIFNNIPYNDKSIIDIKMAKNRKISNHTFNYIDVKLEHINYFMNL